MTSLCVCVCLSVCLHSRACNDRHSGTHMGRAHHGKKEGTHTTSSALDELLALEASGVHEGPDVLVSDLRTRVLMSLDDGLQHVHQLLLDLTRQQPPRGVVVADSLELLVVLHQIGQILVRDIHRQIGTEFSVLLNGRPAAREGVFVDLGLDLLRRVRHEDGTRHLRAGHLGLVALECGDESAVNEGGLVEAQPRGHVARHPEVGVLIYRLWDEAHDVFSIAKHRWEAGRKCGSSLYSGECALADVVAFGEAEDATRLIVGDLLLNLQHQGVHCLDIVQIREDEGLVLVKTDRQNVLGVLVRKALALLYGEVFLEQELLIVGQLDHQRHVEGVLQPLCEPEGHQMAQVQRLARRSPPCV
mmetsp:Transcript_3736/g.9327  ORF Transcript_3736/g.9327 Transcript_3736/m.9327 type:complete len:359 (-) Transcript_3736:1020-2096(-)